MDVIGTLTRQIGTLQHFEWLRWIVITVLCLNVVDAALTLYWITTGQAEEANPVLRELAHEDPVMFVVLKLILVTVGSMLLWRFRKRKLAVFSIFLSFLAYYLVLIHHLGALNFF